MLKQKDREKQEFISKLFASYCDQLKIVIRFTMYSKSEYDLDDCLQNVFRIALDKYDILKDHPTPYAWLLRVARLEGKRHNQQSMRHRLDKLDESLPADANVEENVIENILYREYRDKQVIERVLAALTPEELALYQMRWKDKLSPSEIAERLCIDISNAKVKIHRLHRKILNILHDIIEKQL